MPTGDTEELRVRWDKRHQEAEGVGNPAKVLLENLHLLPSKGDALDLACGRGANALLLAEAGLRVQAWDLSSVAIERLQAEADSQGLDIQAQARDVITQPPSPGSCDVIVVSHFLDRSLAPQIIEALRPGGLLFYQTFSQVAVTDRGPDNPAFRLADNELLGLFSALLVRAYREEGRLGDTSRGWRDIAMLVAEKPQ
jgi:2-polyprenyl-3-methyl-5-hydroxy-6-metoxy-1,4-benzoquinol methylase